MRKATKSTVPSGGLVFSTLAALMPFSLISTIAMPGCFYTSQICTDSTSLIKLLYRLRPGEIYHLGAQSHVRVSFDIPEYAGDISALGTTRLLEVLRETGLKPKFFQASSSNMFRAVPPPSNEQTAFRPRSP